MNGAIAELCATTMSAPKRKRLKITGSSHQRLLPTKNESSSPAIPKRRTVLCMNFMISPSNSYDKLPERLLHGCDGSRTTRERRKHSVLLQFLENPLGYDGMPKRAVVGIACVRK